MNTRYQQATFAFSANSRQQLAGDSVAEVAFAGRSNAGKSSALNTLTGQKSLARVSKTPGRTQLINYFALPEAGHYLVDLPGYGYADVPERIRTHWEGLLSQYLLEREVLRGVVLIMDIRHPLRERDIRMLECCAARRLPVHILLTKADKLGRGGSARQLQMVKKELLHRDAPVSVQTFSSLKKQGLESLTGTLDKWFCDAG